MIQERKMNALVSYLRKQTSSKSSISKYLNSPAWLSNPDPANDVRSSLKEMELDQFKRNQMQIPRTAKEVEPVWEKSVELILKKSDPEPRSRDSRSSEYIGSETSFKEI